METIRHAMKSMRLFGKSGIEYHIWFDQYWNGNPEDHSHREVLHDWAGIDKGVKLFGEGARKHLEQHLKDDEKPKRAIVLGTFDLTHYGHYNKFKLLKEKGYYTIAGVTSDEFATTYKRKPSMTQKERMLNLEACKWVDKVIELNTPYDHTKEVLKSEADFVVRSNDWTIKGYTKQTGLSPEWMTKHNVKTLILPYTEGVSTTELINRVKDNE